MIGIGVALLVAERDELALNSVDLAVPVFGAVQPGDVVEAWFETDLADAELLSILATGETILYVVAGAYVSDPWRINADR